MSIQQAADKRIVARGVLLDYKAWNPSKDKSHYTLSVRKSKIFGDVIVNADADRNSVCRYRILNRLLNSRIYLATGRNWATFLSFVSAELRLSVTSARAKRWSLSAGPSNGSV
jgi:hypothetical protein